jgi:hypothetical protein
MEYDIEKEGRVSNLSNPNNGLYNSSAASEAEEDWFCERHVQTFHWLKQR